ncbi:MAG: ABC transporter permease [Thermaerobacterales bacterium]
MILAWNEIRHRPGRYVLLTILLTVIGLLVTLLSGLAGGLGQGMNGVIARMPADMAALHADADLNLQRSRLPAELVPLFERLGGVHRAAGLAHLTATGLMGEETFRVALFGVEAGSLAEPPLIEGRSLGVAEKGAVTVDRSLLRQYDLALGDLLILRELDRPLRITGITADQRFSMQPAAFVTFAQWQDAADLDEPLINTIMIRGDHDLPVSRLIEGIQWQADHYAEEGLIQIVSLSDLAAAVPGAGEMRLIPLLLLLIALAVGGVVTGVFFAFLTLQRQSEIGVLKALGAGNGLLLKTMLLQAFLVSLTGALLGSGLGWGLAGLMPPSVSVVIRPVAMVVAVIGIITASLAASLTSIHLMSRVEPADALAQPDW